MARASAQITLCLCFHSDGADARVVRPYIVIMAVLMCKMVEIVRCSNACRDARSVRPLKHPHVYVSIPMGRTHEPCVHSTTPMFMFPFRRGGRTSRASLHRHYGCIDVFYKA